MRFGSICSGCGAMDLALEQAGMRCAWQIELDRSCRAVLEHHWPGKLAGSDLAEVDPAGLPAVDLVCAGLPCQDYSVAGGRAGLAGDRGALFWQFLRVVAHLTPPWLLIENVDGLLTSNDGRDFATFVGELGKLGYLGSWRVLDAEYFGVPQRRYRVFLVGCLGAVCPPEVLFEPGCLPGDPPARGEEGESVAALLAGGARGRGWRIGADEAVGGQLVARTLTAHGTRLDGDSDNFVPAVARALTASWDASEDSAGRGVQLVGALTSSVGGADDNDGRAGHLVIPYHLAHITGKENRANPQPGDSAPTANQDSRLVVAYACQGNNVGPAGTLRRGNGGITGGVPFIVNAAESTAKASHARESEVARCLDSTGGFASSQGGTVVAHGVDLRNGVLGEVAPTMQAGGHGACPNATPHVIASFNAKAGGDMRGCPNAPREVAGSVTGSNPQGAITQTGVRRLTPRECERLQGLPDDWTRWGAFTSKSGRLYARELKDSPRYRMIGNAVAVPVVRWIGARILAADATEHRRTA